MLETRVECLYERASPRQRLPLGCHHEINTLCYV